ncbi:MAG: putative glycoside hydrolase [Candidatus Peribacteraceae bacterium]|nr:putative glycoside hydrolase [Candidatus Peribacteraceae bacterium]
MDFPAIIGIRTSVRTRILMIFPEEMLWGMPPPDRFELRIESPRQPAPRVLHHHRLHQILFCSSVLSSVAALSLLIFAAPDVFRLFQDFSAAPAHNVQRTSEQPRQSDLQPFHGAAPLIESGSLTDQDDPSDTPLSESGATGTGERATSSSGSVSTPTDETVPLRRADNVTGVFLTAGSTGREEFLRYTMDALLAASGSALVFDVKGGSVLYHSAAPMALERHLVVPRYDLPAVLKTARERGIYTIGRFVAVKDGGLTRASPETAIRDPKTGRVLSRDWIDPADPTAIAYNMEVICELSKAGIDEINLDYLRFSTAEFGALSVYSGAEKADRVEIFIRAARNTINRCGPDTRLGISTYAILGWRYDQNVETLGQDVVRFAPLVDIISPMAYPATFSPTAYYNPGKDPGSRMYYLVYRTLTGYAELLGPEQAKKLRPWIQGYGVTFKNMQDQMQGVYDAGACGFTVWNANNAYDTTYRAMKRMTGKRPERCGAGSW